MAKFYGTLIADHTSKKVSTRTGRGAISAVAQSWLGSVRVDLYMRSAEKKDDLMVRIGFYPDGSSPECNINAIDLPYDEFFNLILSKRQERP